VLIKTIIVVSTLAVISSPQIVWGSNIPIKELNNRLLSAVFNNNFALVKSTITAGANPKATNNEGLTAAGLAVEKGYFNIAHYILGVIQQKSSAKEENTRITSGKLNKNNPQTSMTTSINEKNQISAPTPAPKLPIFLEPKTYKKWPENTPNPFSPGTQPNESMPIIGTIQKLSVEPTTQGQAINLKIKTQDLNTTPLKTPDVSVFRKTKEPTPILTLGKQEPKEIPIKKARSLKSEKAKADQEDEFEEEDLFDKVWNKINKSF
jgi:hypothetical protein